MDHFLFFFNGMTFFLCLSAVIPSVLFFFKFKSKILLYFSFFLIMIMGVLWYDYLLLYLKVIHRNNVHLFVQLIYTIPDSISGIILIINTPILVNEVCSKKLSKKQWYFFIGLGSIYLLIVPFVYTDFSNQPFYSPSKNIYIGIVRILELVSIIYSLFIVFTSYQSIENALLRKWVLGIALFSVPVVLLVMYIPFLMQQSAVYQFILPFYLLIIVIASIRTAYHHFFRPTYCQGLVISDYFVQRFKISQRESTIIQHAVSGLSNKEISEKLFISIKTTESHLSTIYKKTAVSNRVQLANLIYSNKQQ